MTKPNAIWISARHNSLYRCGGWAFVALRKGQPVGVAGGERHTTARRMALSALAAALKALPPEPAASAEPLSVTTDSPDLAALAAFLAGPMDPASGAGLPDDIAPDLDLLAQVRAAAKARRLAVARQGVQPGAPLAFAAAWAELSLDKAKATGPFAAAIPKPNLVKAAGLATA